MLSVFFFFKQKTAYEMRISDWSSDVCSSDLRLSDYSNTGTSTTWKAGGTWEPFRGYKLRGIYQHSVRSPNISELFTPITTGLANLAEDPCQGSNPVGNAELTAICLAQGAPAGPIGNIPDPSSGQINQTGGGNRPDERREGPEGGSTCNPRVRTE